MRKDLPYRAWVSWNSKGKITLRVRTSGYRGNKTWGADVYTNDPTWKQFNLIVKAYVKTLLTVSPAYVTLYSTGNEIITREVEIRAELPRPLTLTPIQFSLGGTLTYRIDEIEKGKRFMKSKICYSLWCSIVLLTYGLSMVTTLSINFS